MSIVDSVGQDVNGQTEVFIAFLQDQIDFHKKSVERYADETNPYRSAKHQKTAADFRDLRDFILLLDKKLEKTEKAARRPPLALSPEDIEGLPQEQIDQLSLTSADKAEFSIMAMLETSGGIMSLDQIIVGLYREIGEIQMRSKITARLHRMGVKGLIYKVPTKKGVYSLDKINEKDAEAMFKGAAIK